MIRHRLVVYVILSVAIAAALYPDGDVAAQPQKASDLRREVLTEWAKRRIKIKSYSMTADVTELQFGRGDKPADPPGPFSVARPKENHIANVTLQYVREQEKAAMKLHYDKVVVESDPLQTEPRSNLASYDGRTNRELFTQVASPITIGLIEDGDAAGPALAVNSHLVPILLWKEPRRLIKDIGWEVDRMTLVDFPVDVGGVKCHRLNIPRKGGKWTSTLDVDAERGWLPIQWQGWFNDKPMFVWRIQYKHDKAFGPVVTAWHYTAFQENGGMDKERSGTAKEYQINTDVDDSRFTIEFPVGTHVQKGWGEEESSYFIQQSEGLRRISEKDFGKINTDGE